MHFLNWTTPLLYIFRKWNVTCHFLVFYAFYKDVSFIPLPYYNKYPWVSRLLGSQRRDIKQAAQQMCTSSPPTDFASKLSLITACLTAPINALFGTRVAP